MRPSVRVVKSVDEGLILKETNQQKKDRRKAERDAARAHKNAVKDAKKRGVKPPPKPTKSAPATAKKKESLFDFDLSSKEKRAFEAKQAEEREASQKPIKEKKEKRLKDLRDKSKEARDEAERQQKESGLSPEEFRELQRLEREIAEEKKTEPSSPVRVTDSSKEKPKTVKVVDPKKGDRQGKGGKTQKGFASLGPYMGELVNRYQNGEIDATTFYEDIIFANNMLLGRALGQEKEEMLQEREDGFPAMLEEPLLNGPVMMHFKRLSSEFPELKDVQEADEEMNGSLEDAQGGAKGIRADISSFIADPLNEGRPHQQKDINGIYQLLSKYDHPLGVTLSADIPKSDRIQSNYTPSKNRRIRVAGRMQDPSFEQEMNRLRDEQMENLKFREDKRFTADRDKGGASRFYEKLFQEGSVTPQRRGQSSFELNRPSSTQTKSILNQVKDIARQESIDEKTAYNKMMSGFNDYMISLTGEKAFGTSGRAGKYGKGIEEREAPDAITPSMAEAAKQLGLSSPVPNMPDVLVSSYLKDPKSAYSQKTRAKLADELASMGQEGFHPTLTSAMGEAGLLSSLYGDETAVTTEGSGLTGSQEEKEQKASEARRGRFGGSQTEFDMMSPEDQLAVVQGKRKLTPSQRMTQLERQLSQGDIDEYDYEMQRAAINLDQHKLDSDAELGGLNGNDFEVGHAYHGLNEDQLVKQTNNFVDNLIGMSRIMREIRYKAYHNNDAETDEEKSAIDKKLSAVGLTAENFVAFGNLDNATLEEKQRYNKLDAIISPMQYVNTAKAGEKPKMKSVPGVGTLGDMLPVMMSRMNRQHDMMKEIGMSNVDLVKAAMKYANADMGIQGYHEAFASLGLQAQKGGLSTYPIYRLLQYLRKKGYREALDEEHHQKSEGQIQKFAKNHTKRQELKEQGFSPASEYSPEDMDHILHDKEQCLSCHEDRFGTRDGASARVHSPVKGKKSPFAHKSLTLPQLTNYQKNGEEYPLYANGVNENDTSLGSILRHIYPDNDFYKYKYLMSQEANAPNKQKWRDDTSRKMRNKIKEAVITGHPRAANIFKKFGLYRTKDNAIATGPAGMTNKELVASSFFMNNDDSVDKHQESMRKRTLLSTRFNAITDAMDFMEEIADGVYGKKIKPGALKTSRKRRELLDEMLNEPKTGIEKATGIIEKRKRELDTYKEAYARYLQEKAIYDDNLAKTKPRKYIDADGEEREERGEYDSPGQIAMIQQQGDDIQNKYGKMLALRKTKLSNIKTQEKKIAKFKDASDDSINRTNQYMLGAFIGKDEYRDGKIYNASDKLAKIFATMKKQPGEVTQHALMGMLAELHDDMYGDDDYDSVFKTDDNAIVKNDFTHSLSNYKLGRMGEMGGTGVMSITNNKAIPRINSMNQLLAHRIQMGFPLKEEDIERAKGMLHDADMADTVDKEKFKEWSKEMTIDDDDSFNISELEHEHHDDTENELGLLTEEEAARREQNSHFTRGSEEAIANGDIEAHNLVSNWRDNAPTLCGVCHGHRFVSRDEAVSYIRHRIPGMEDEGRESSKINNFIHTKMRPRGYGSYDEHPMADEMEPSEHEQFACPACEHTADYVQGGKCSNGLCGDCFGTGVRDPANDEHIHEGYTDAEGNKIDGKNHHYSHNSMVNEKFDYLNQLLLSEAEMMQSGEIPDYLKEVIQPQSPIWEMFDNHVGSGKFQTFEEEREARKKKKFEPFKIDPNEPEASPQKKIKVKEPAKVGDMPTLDFNIDMGDSAPVANFDIPDNFDIDMEDSAPVGGGMELNSVNTLAMQKHNEIMLKKHLDNLYASAVTGLNKRFGDNTSPEMIKEMRKEIEELYNSIVNDPSLQDMHNNDEHHLVEKMHKLQEIADDRFVDDIDVSGMSAKERKAIRAKRRQLPVDENGDLQLTMDDVFGGNAPMSFNSYDKYYPYHGHMLTETEIREGLFEPGKENKPKPVTNHQLRGFFAGNTKKLRTINRVEKAAKDTKRPEKAEKIKSALDGIEKPMVARKTVNLYSESLNDIMKEFGEQPMIGEMENHQLTYSEEAQKAFKDAGATDVNSMLTAKNKINQHRALNEGYSRGKNMALKPLWQEYVMRKALQHFMSRVNNPLKFPTIPAGINQNNFVEMTRGNSGLFQLMKDEAAKVAGYEDEEDLEKKLNMSTSPTINGVKMNVREFKADVMQNAKHEDSHQLPLCHFQYNAKGKWALVVKDAGTILQENQQQLLKPNDMKEYEAMIRAVNYNKRPNYMRREEIKSVIDGQDGENDGYDGFGEVSTAFANKALPPKQQRLLETSGPVSKLSHPNLTQNSYADTLSFALAADKDHKYQNMRQQQGITEPRFIDKIGPMPPISFPQYPDNPAVGTTNPPPAGPYGGQNPESIYANEGEYPN